MSTRVVLQIALMTLFVHGASSQTQKVSVGIVRLDGRIVPFAAYENGRWEQAWPEPRSIQGTAEVDPTVGNIASVWQRRGERTPSVWHVWPASGEASIQTRVNGVEVAQVHCHRQLVLKTDLPVVNGDDHFKVGVAVDSSNVAVRAIEEVPHGNPQWAAAERTLRASFTRLEAAQAATDGRELPQETPPPVPQLLRLHRVTGSSGSPMYFVAQKKYRTDWPPDDPGCRATTIMTGWLVSTPTGEHRLLDPKVFVTNCDAKIARTAWPVAAFSVSNREFWVLQEHGWGDETYVIAEIQAGAVRYPIMADGGGC